MIMVGNKGLKTIFGLSTYMQIFMHGGKHTRPGRKLLDTSLFENGPKCVIGPSPVFSGLSPFREEGF